MKNLSIVALLIILLVSCTKEKQAGEVLIRVQNQSTLAAQDVKVYSETLTGGTEIEKTYGNIAAGGSSNYQQHPRVYIPYYSFSIPGQGIMELKFVRCLTGAAPLNPGKYSLIIKMDDTNQPYVDFRQD